MKQRLLIKKYNFEVRQLELQLKRDKHLSHDRTFLSYEHYEGEFTWSDIYFIGTYEGRKRLFNCTITSSIDEFNNLVDDEVGTRLDELYPDRYKNTDMLFEDDENLSEPNSKFKLKSIKFVTHDEELQKQIDSKKAEILKEILEGKKISVRSYAEVLPDYQYGIGFNMCTQEKMLNREIVLEYVKRIQNMNLIGFDRMFLSDDEIFFDANDHYESEINHSRPINV